MPLLVDVRFVCDGCGASEMRTDVGTCGGILSVSVNDVDMPEAWREVAGTLACSDRCYETAFEKARGLARRQAIERVDAIYNRMREEKK